MAGGLGWRSIPSPTYHDHAQRKVEFDLFCFSQISFLQPFLNLPFAHLKTAPGTAIWSCGVKTWTILTYLDTDSWRDSTKTQIFFRGVMNTQLPYNIFFHWRKEAAYVFGLFMFDAFHLRFRLYQGTDIHHNTYQMALLAQYSTFTCCATCSQVNFTANVAAIFSAIKLLTITNLPLINALVR